MFVAVCLCGPIGDSHMVCGHGRFRLGGKTRRSYIHGCFYVFACFQLVGGASKHGIMNC